MSGACVYVVPNGRGSGALLCLECLAAVEALPGGLDVLRCDVGLRHAYACESVSRGWLAGRKLCGPGERIVLVAHVKRLRPVLDDESRRVLDGFLGLVVLARE